VNSPATILCLFLVTSAASAPAPSETPSFGDPTSITNVHWPFEPGGIRLYRGHGDGVALVVVERCLAATRVFELGGELVECVVLEECEYANGALFEVSLQYFAQADDGAVYMFGELVAEIEDGRIVGHGGSWLVGGPSAPRDPSEAVDAGAPTVFMPNHPQLGEWWLPGNPYPVLDTTATVVCEDAELEVPAGAFDRVLVVRETSARPDVEDERKWWAPKVGVVQTQSKDEQLRLVASSF